MIRGPIWTKLEDPMPVQYAIASASEGGGCNEDAAVARIEDGTFVAAVADGHAGYDADSADTAAFAQFVAEQAAGVMTCCDAPTIPRGFDVIAERVRQRHFNPNIGAVVGAVAIPENGRSIVVAHAGDVRLYADARGNSRGFQFFTNDHVPCRPDEYRRVGPVEKTGRFAILDHPHSKTNRGGRERIIRRLHYRNPYGGWCSGGIRVSRGFGDVHFQPAFIHEPDVRVVSFDDLPNHTTFALCSDGARRNVGRTFAHFERKGGKPHDIEEYPSVFLAFHEDEADDDGTVVFFRANFSRDG